MDNIPTDERLKWQHRFRKLMKSIWENIYNPYWYDPKNPSNRNVCILVVSGITFDPMFFLSKQPSEGKK